MIHLMKNLQWYFLEEQLTQESLSFLRLHGGTGSTTCDSAVSAPHLRGSTLWDMGHFHAIPTVQSSALRGAESQSSPHFPPTPAPNSAVHEGSLTAQGHCSVGDTRLQGHSTCTQGQTALQIHVTSKCSWGTEEIKCMRDSPQLPPQNAQDICHIHEHGPCGGVSSEEPDLQRILHRNMAFATNTYFFFHKQNLSIANQKITSPKCSALLISRTSVKSQKTRDNPLRMEQGDRVGSESSD